MKIKKLREKSSEELKSLELELLRDIYNRKNEARVTKKMDKTNETKSLKKTRAPVLTLLTEIENSN